MGFWDFTSTAWETFISVVPMPIKVAIFILFINLIVSLLVTMFLSPFITCDGNSAYNFKDMNDKLKFEASKIQWSSCLSENVYQQTKGLNVTAYGVKVGVISGMLNMVYDTMNYLTSFILNPIQTISMSFNKNDDHCSLSYTDIDPISGDNKTITLNLSTTTTYRDLILANNGRRTCDPKDTTKEVVCGGCKADLPKLLLFERLDIFDYKLWLLLYVLGFVGIYTINKMQY